MQKQTHTSQDHLDSKQKFYTDSLALKDQQLDELRNEALRLRDKNDRLQRERDGWKSSSRKEGVFGFFLGTLIFFWVGFLVGAILIR